MRKLSDYFKGESLDFLKEVELQNVRLYKKDASVELECISQRMLMEGERLQIKRLFAESLGIDSKNIKLIVHCTQKTSYSSENMQQYICLLYTSPGFYLWIISSLRCIAGYLHGGELRKRDF